ncbi:MAG TPA: hypothetical protein VM573_01650 [Actinomycetota bacterium]|jgi:hypothetical protein|nr:hypothetical protein [Actinomycetota bacterium]
MPRVARDIGAMVSGRAVRFTGGMRRPLLAAVVALIALSCGDDAPPAARRTIPPGAPEIYEHERAGHVPASMVPGRWRSGGRVLVLGEVNEVRLDGKRLGTYRAHMEGAVFENDIAGCSEARWHFEDGDLVLTGGVRCPLVGRWRRAR